MSLYVEILDKIAALITAAFGLVAALAWNEAIKNWFAEQESLSSAGPWVYAIIITIIAVIMTILIARAASKAKKKLETAEKEKA